MIKKKSRFLTFVFSMLPGAGHMYIGFMKIGLSFMSMFFFLIFLASWTNMDSLIFILPLIWFYSFFDCMNKASLEDEQLLILEDKYLFSIDKLAKLDINIGEKSKLVSGILVLIFGIFLVADNIINMLSPYIPNELRHIIHGLMRQTPQVIVGVAIVAIGVRLIKGKKRECKIDD